MKLLEVKNLTKRFRGLVALDDVSCDVEQGEIFGLIGPNGSGKTVLFNTITGIYQDDGGEIRFNGKRINRMPSHVLVNMGIARTFQGSRVFPTLSVLENVKVGLHCRTRANFMSAILSTPGTAREARETEDKALQILKTIGLGLDELKDTKVADLTYVMRAFVGLAIALATEPKIILLDEPLAGMNPTEVNWATDLIKRIRDSGVTVFWVEHHTKAIMSGCDRVMVLDSGLKIAEGKPAEIVANQKVLEAYLGKGYNAKN